MATLKSCEKCGRTFVDGGLWTAGVKTMCYYCENGIDPWLEWTKFKKACGNDPNCQRIKRQFSEAMDKIIEDRKNKE